MDDPASHEQARRLLQDALHIFDALVALSHPELKLTLRKAALSAAEMAVAVLKGERCSCAQNEEEQMDLSDIPAVEDDPPQVNPLRYTEFIAMIMPALRSAYPERAQQENITHAAQLWQRHKGYREMALVVAHATHEVEDA